MADTVVDPNTGAISISLTPQEKREKDYQKKVRKLEKEVIELKKEVHDLNNKLESLILFISNTNSNNDKKMNGKKINTNDKIRLEDNDEEKMFSKEKKCCGGNNK